MEYKSRSNILLILDIIALSLSFSMAIGIRYTILIKNLGSELITSTYIVFFAFALLMYVVVFLLYKSPRPETQSYREIVITTLRQQIVFVSAYIMLFFLFHQAGVISRVVVVLFFIGNNLLIILGRVLYHRYCMEKTRRLHSLNTERDSVFRENGIESFSVDTGYIRHVYIIGSKSLGLFGGFESFVRSLLQEFSEDRSIKFHVSCKLNGDGFMELSKLPGAITINDNEFIYCNAHCFMVPVRA